jgi:hypothetical protein
MVLENEHVRYGLELDPETVMIEGKEKLRIRAVATRFVSGAKATATTCDSPNGLSMPTYEVPSK